MQWVIWGVIYREILSAKSMRQSSMIYRAAKIKTSWRPLKDLNFRDYLERVVSLATR